LSEKAYAEIIDKSETDETLLEKLGPRLDISLHIFRRLLERVSEAARSRILALASAAKRDDIAEILASISNGTVEVEEVDRDFVAAERIVWPMNEGQLDQVALLGFAKARQDAATVTALATLCDINVDMIKRMLEGGRNEPPLIPCKVANVSWPTLQALLQDEVLGRTASDDELIKLKATTTSCHRRPPGKRLSSGPNIGRTQKLKTRFCPGAGLRRTIRLVCLPK